MNALHRAFLGYKPLPDSHAYDMNIPDNCSYLDNLLPVSEVVV